MMRRLFRHLLPILCTISLAACVTLQGPLGPSREQMAAYQAECRQLWSEELPREIDPQWLAGCIDARAHGASLSSLRVELQTTDEWQALHPPHIYLPRLVVRGGFLGFADGSRFTVIGTSSFRAYQRWLDEPDHTALGELFDDYRDAGYNFIRVFGMYNNPRRDDKPGGWGIGRFIPSEYAGRYYEGLGPFWQFAADHGLRVEFVVFADTQAIMPGADAQLAHWAPFVTGYLWPETTALIEAVNENDQTINRVDALFQLQRPTWTLASHGSNGNAQWPVWPAWDYIGFHVSGFEWHRKAAHNCFEIGWLVAASGNWRGPCVANETQRGGTPPNGDAFSTAVAYSVGRAGALLPAGTYYHNYHGKYSEPWDDVERGQAAAFAAGAHSLPLDCQDGGNYVHRQDLENVDILRVYQRDARADCLAPIPVR